MDAIVMQRQAKDNFFKNDAYSPLQPEQQAKFNGLQYYEPNPTLRFELTPEPFPDQIHVQMQTSTGDTRSYMRWGRAKFTVEGQEAELTLYFSPGQAAFFVPFMDATSSTETYDAGRYVEAERLPNGKVLLDFNVAYSPYCAYNEPPSLAASAGREPVTWSCPIPPKENRLKVPIRAGEKKPIGDWVIQDGEAHLGQDDV
jgi:uncharacterized protein (DUF1684 family)